MTIENIAAEIVEKLHELVRDSKSNAQDTIAGIIKNGLSRFSERAPNLRTAIPIARKIETVALKI